MLALLLVLFLLRDFPWRLDEYDQAKQAFTSLEMVKSGAWWFQHTPGCRGIATKPPLVGWISAAFYGVTGSWEWAWRLPSLLAALTLLVLLWREGERLLPRFGGTLAAGAFGFNVLTPRLAALVRTDLPLCLWITLLGLLVARHVRDGTRPWTPRARWAVFTVLLVAMMTKGPVAYAFLLPGMVALVNRHPPARRTAGRRSGAAGGTGRSRSCPSSSGWNAAWSRCRISTARWSCASSWAASRRARRRSTNPARSGPTSGTCSPTGHPGASCCWRSASAPAASGGRSAANPNRSGSSAGPSGDWSSCRWSPPSAWTASTPSCPRSAWSSPRSSPAPALRSRSPPSPRCPQRLSHRLLPLRRTGRSTGPSSRCLIAVAVPSVDAVKSVAQVYLHHEDAPSRFGAQARALTIGTLLEMVIGRDNVLGEETMIVYLRRLRFLHPATPTASPARANSTPWSSAPAASTTRAACSARSIPRGSAPRRHPRPLAYLLLARPTAASPHCLPVPEWQPAPPRTANPVLPRPASPDPTGACETVTGIRLLPPTAPA